MKRIILSIFIAGLAVSGAVWVYLNRDNEESQTPPATNESTPDVRIPESDQAQTITVTYTDNGFAPASITVTAGTTVVFANQSSSSMWVASNPHPVHTDYSQLDAGRGYSPGESYSFTFTEAGEYGFHNHLNPNRTGTIIVE